MIFIDNVCKKIGNKSILNNISFNVDKGKIIALIGPNGAGKTTLLRCLTGIYDVTHGSIKFDGSSVYENPMVKEKISFVSDESYYSSMTSLSEIIDYYKSTYKNFSFEQFVKLNKLFKIDLNKKITQLSKGMKMKFSIMIALSTGAEYLILDEPTLGLDVISKKMFLDILLDSINENNAAILIASHNLQDLEKICDEVVILDNGGVSSHYSLDDLKYKFRKIQVAFDDISLLDSLKLNSILHVTKLGKVATLICNDYEIVKEKLNTLNPIFIEELDLSLEEIFLYSLGEREVM